MREVVVNRQVAKAKFRHDYRAPIADPSLVGSVFEPEAVMRMRA